MKTSLSSERSTIRAPNQKLKKSVPDMNIGHWEEKDSIDPMGIETLDVPYIKQRNDYLCTESSVVMLLRYWGIDKKSPSEVEKSGYPDFEDLEAYLSEFGIIHEIGAHGPNKLRKLVKKGYPILLRLDPKGQNHGHTVLMVGPIKGDGIVYHDPYFGKKDGSFSWMSDATYNKIRKKRKGKALLFVPKR